MVPLLYGFLSVRTSIMVPQKCQYFLKSGSVPKDQPPKSVTLEVSSSKSLIVRSPLGLLSVRRRRRMGVSAANLQTCHSPEGLQNTPTMPSREASVAPTQVAFLGWTLRRWVVHSANEVMLCHQRLIFSCTAAVMLIRLVVSTFRSC